MSSAQPLETSYVERSSPRVVASSPEPLAERIAPWVAAVACVWFALAATWGLFGPIVAGHYGTMGGEGIIGENMVRWRILGPVWDVVSTEPTPAQYYCHHPWGGFWIQAFLIAIFGHHDFVLPLPAVLMSVATPPLLYGIGRDAWGKIPGAAAAVGFVFLPITLGFANFHNVEVTLLFGCALFFWGHARMLKTWKRRHLAASIVGCAVAASADWPAYVMLATFLGVSFVRFFLPTKWALPLSFRRYATWWGLAVATSVGLLALWVVLFARSDKLLDWLGSASTRGLGVETSLSAALEARKSWIDISFTPPVILIGKIVAPLALFRLVWRRRDEEAYSLSILAGATVSYVFFKQAADIHIFWSHYFGGYFALAFAQLIATVGELGSVLARRLRVKREHVFTHAVPLGLTVLFALAIWPDGARALRYARETGGRFNENGIPVRSETNLLAVLYRIKDRLPPYMGPAFAPDIRYLWNYGWTSAGQGDNIAGPPTDHVDASHPRPIVVARAQGLTVEQQKALVSTYHVEIYDNEVWVIDRRQAAAPLDAYAFEEREPSFWEWYFISGVEPMRSYVRDPYSTWEWRAHLGQETPPPDFPPRTWEQKRIAHNIAVAEGNTAKAAELRAEIERTLTRDAATSFTQGLSLLGFYRIGGTEPRIVNLFQASQDGVSDATFEVRAVVERRKPLSLVPPDPVLRVVSLPAPMSTRLYRPGFLYAHTVVLRQRLGVERFWGSFLSKGIGPPPARLDGRYETPLLVAN